MSKKIFYLILLFSLLPLLGCQKSKNSGTTIGNPLTVSMAGSSQSATTIAMNHLFEKILNLFMPRVNALTPPATITDASGGTVALNQGWVVIRDIELKETQTAGPEETETIEISLAGPFCVNLFDLAPTRLGEITTNHSTIQRIQMKLSKEDSSSASTSTITPPSGLSGQAIFLSGQINSVSFSFRTTQETEFTIAGAAPLNELSHSNLLVSIHISNLIKKINLSSITTPTEISDSNTVPATNPCPLIDPSAQNLSTCFIKGLQSEANLGKDSDSDGELESGEDTVRDSSLSH